MMLSQKAMEISPSLTLAISAKAKKMKSEGLDVIGFGVGEPDFDTPKHIREAGIKAIEEGYTRYTPASGTAELKQAIVDKFKKDNNLSYKPSQIVVSSGAKQSLDNAFRAVLNPGDEVIVGSPYWVSYPEMIRLSDGVPVIVETKEEEFFKFNIDTLEKVVTEKTKAMIINSPSNPTGAIYSKEELEKIAEFAQKHDIIIISDEIYEKLIYGTEVHTSIASISEDAYNRTIVINGVSKAYAMTGWRIGYAAANEKIASLMSNIQSHTTSNPCSISQHASLAALKGDQSPVVEMNKEFEKRRNFMVERVNTINNLSCVKPDGAFYVMVNISKVLGKKIEGKVIENSFVFGDLLLEKEKVAVVPGVAFGADEFIRLSYATSMENIKEGLDRIEKFVGDLK